MKYMLCRKPKGLNIRVSRQYSVFEITSSRRLAYRIFDLTPSGRNEFFVRPLNVSQYFVYWFIGIAMVTTTLFN